MGQYFPSLTALLDRMPDVTRTPWLNGHALIYNAISGKIENRAITAADITQPFASLCASGTGPGDVGVTAVLDPVRCVPL